MKFNLFNFTVGIYCSISEGRDNINDLTIIAHKCIWISSGDASHCLRINFACSSEYFEYVDHSKMIQKNLLFVDNLLIKFP